MKRIPTPVRTACTAMIATAALAGCGDLATSLETGPAQTSAAVSHISYDARDAAEYGALWANIYGPLELAAGGELDVTRSREVIVSAEPFHVGSDYSVYDHLKYIAISTQSFDVPEIGSLTFAVDITADVSGTQIGRVVHGCYGPGFSFPDASCSTGSYRGARCLRWSSGYPAM